jgi:3-phenylpropionate/trans-cinnamate dioxygenase ferredoxin reductase subunit
VAQAGVVIIGGGLAAAQAAIQLRQLRWQGPITILSAERVAPYWKPPLSKSILQGTEPPESAWIRPDEFWARRRIDLRLNTPVTRLDPAAKTIGTADGGILRYDHAVLATGASCVVPPLAGLNLPGVHVLRSLDDALALRDATQPGVRVVVLGGGFIGLEAASALTARGAAVTVIEREPRLLARVASLEISAAVLALHRRHGVEVLLGRAALRVKGVDRVQFVQLEDGQEVDCDFVLVSVGIRPETGLAEAAGLSCNDGILVNNYMQTGADGVWAVGDCVRFPSARYGRLLRLESIQNAIEGATALAAGICDKPSHYDPLPMISSVQFGQQLDFIGLADVKDESRFFGSGEEYVLVHSKSETCLAAECLNAATETMAALRRAITLGEPLRNLANKERLQA